MDFPFKYSAYLFDLDNTLYSERSYLFPAYRQIAIMIGNKTGGNKNSMAQFLVDEFSKFGREQIFDKLFDKFQVSGVSLDECLQLLRNVNPGKLALYPMAQKTLLELKEQGKILGVITNGNVIQQKNKVANIDWNGLDSNIEFIYANETEKKPSPLTINNFLMKHNLPTGSVLMVGDGKEDEKAARAAKVEFMFTTFIKNNI